MGQLRQEMQRFFSEVENHDGPAGPAAEALSSFARKAVRADLPSDDLEAAFRGVLLPYRGAEEGPGGPYRRMLESVVDGLHEGDDKDNAGAMRAFLAAQRRLPGRLGDDALAVFERRLDRAAADRARAQHGGVDPTRAQVAEAKSTLTEEIQSPGAFDVPPLTSPRSGVSEFTEPTGLTPVSMEYGGPVPIVRRTR